MHNPPMLAALHYSQLETEVMAEIAAAMSTFYGLCMCMVEVNGCGLYPVKKLQELEIPVWERKRPDTQGNIVEVSGGWNSTEAVRKTIVDHLGALIAKWKPENPTFICYSLHMINQFKKFIRTKTGRDEAMPGENDDDVLQAAMGLYNMGSATEMRAPERRKVNVRKMLEAQHWRLGSSPGGRRN
jgi:hypothetical protein